MRVSRSVIFWILPAAIAALTGGTIAGSPQVQTVQATDVPPLLRVRSFLDHVRHAHQRGALGTNAWDRAVTISWTASAITNLQPDWSLIPDVQTGASGPYLPSNSLQRLPTRYFPTSACALNETTIVVAGLGPSGATILERWDLGWPEHMPEPVSDATGIIRVFVVHPSISLVSRFYAADVPGRRVIKAMTGIRGRSTGDERVLVLFEDSNDLYVMNPYASLASQAPVLLASSTDDTGTIGYSEPNLTGNLSGIWFGDRPQVGYIYKLDRGFFCQEGAIQNGDPNRPHMVLVDSQRNGSIDTLLLITSSAWQDQRWFSLDEYDNWWMHN